jgi:hypothetical protein
MMRTVDNDESVECISCGGIPMYLEIDDNDTICTLCDDLFCEGPEPDFEAMRQAAMERHPVSRGVERRSDRQFYEGY